MQHTYYRCRAPEITKIRAAFDDPCSRDNFRDILHRGAVGQDRWLWERALAAKPEKAWAWIPPSDVIHRAPGCNEETSFGGRIATDGSAIHGNFNEAAKAGWAVSKGDSDAIFGAVPLPEQTVLAGELWAIYALLRHATWPTEFIIDNATVVKGLLRGETWSCASARPWAHLWRRIWEKMRDLGLETSDSGLPEGRVLVYKIKSHQGKKARLAQSPLEAERVRMNECADRWAKEGARLVGKPDW